MASKLSLPGCVALAGTAIAACIMISGLLVSDANSITLYVVGILGTAILVFCLLFVIKKVTGSNDTGFLELRLDEDKHAEEKKTDERVPEAAENGEGNPRASNDAA